MPELMTVISIVLAAVAFKYRDYIQQQTKDPILVLLILGLIIVVIIVFLMIGHYLEKLLNKIGMWRQGVSLSSQKMIVHFKFIGFDLQEYLKRFYSAKSNSEKTFIGLNAEKINKEIVSITDMQRTQHLQVLGMTGTGKTQSVFLPLICQDALKNRPIIIIDAKGEMGTINQLYSILSSYNRSESFLLFSLVYRDLSCTYNPLYVGNIDPQIVIDAFFNNYEDDNSFFREMAKSIFTNAFYILYSLGKPFVPMDIYCYLNNELCRREINNKIGKDNEQGVLHLRMLNQIISDLTDQYKGWKHAIAGFNNFLISYNDPILNDADSDIVLSEAILQRKIVYFQLPTNAYPVQAVSIARIVQANLRYISSLIQIGRIPQDTLVSVIIDEYAAFAEESFVEVLNKARSSGMMVTLAHQSLSDLIHISESFMKRIDENTLNKIYFKQTDPELCELIAKSMGTYQKIEKTYRMSGGNFGNQIHVGETSNRIVNEFHFSPDKIKSLHQSGQGYFIYRGSNQCQCVNFGQFTAREQKQYVKKVRHDKEGGLGLFERFYLSQSVDKEHIEKIGKQGSHNILNLD